MKGGLKMSLFKILKGDSSRISTDITPFHDGYAYFTPDDGGFYIDSADNGEQKRTRINPSVQAVSAVLYGVEWDEFGRQSIGVPGMGAEQNGLIGLDESASDDVIADAKKGALTIAAQDEASLTIKANGIVPTLDIPVVVILFP